MDATEQLYAGEMGTVHSSGEAAVYLPESLELSEHRAIPQAISNTLETPAAAIRFPAESAAARPHGERALLVAVLKERLPPFQFRHADADIETPATARVPVQVAAGGQTPVACYLAAHGLQDAAIADVVRLDESEVGEAVESVLDQAR
jgi:hypothetical protein